MAHTNVDTLCKIGNLLQAKSDKIYLKGIYVHCGDSYYANSMEGVEKVHIVKQKLNDRNQLKTILFRFVMEPLIHFVFYQKYCANMVFRFGNGASDRRHLVVIQVK